MSVFAALRKGDAAEVLKVAEAQRDALEEPNKNGELPLLVAVETGDVALVEALLDAGADVDAVTSAFDGQTALLAAVWGGDDVMVQELVKAGASLAARDGRKRNAAHACALIGNLPLLEYLADPHEFEPAIAADVKLDLKVTVAAADDDAMTPLHYACAEAAASKRVLEVARFLVTKPPKAAVVGVLTHRSISGRTPLHCLAGAASSQSEVPELVELAKKLAQLAPDALSATDDEGCLPAHVAAEAGARGLFAVLCAATPAAVLGQQTKRKQTVLHLLAAHDDAGVVRTLLDAIPKSTLSDEFWSRQDSKGRSCVDIAVRSGAVKAFEGASVPKELLSKAKAADKTEDPKRTGGAVDKAGDERGDFSGRGTGKMPEKPEDRKAVATAKPDVRTGAPMPLVLFTFAIIVSFLGPLLLTMLRDQGWV